MNEIIIGFIGFGLIGGSIARAIKERYPDYSILVYTKENEINNKESDIGIGAAKKEQIVDEICDSIKPFSHCDIIFLCAPVLINISYIQQLKSIIKPTCILTDVGSVKGNIHEVVEFHSLNHQFIGGHPMTGSEKTGYEHSNAKLLENAFYILTRTQDTRDDKLNLLASLIKQIGAIPIVMDYREHDTITAAISHIPHIIAASLVNLVKKSDDKEEKMRTLAAGGFKDLTRIASSSPIMWQNICLSNSYPIIEFLESYIHSLIEIKDALKKQDGTYLYQLFDTANEYRSVIPNHPIGGYKIHEIHIDLMDEAGAIATVATLLASNKINIKNIGIVHNREFQEGVLRIEFYEAEAKNKAIDLLKKYDYTVYNR